LYNRVDGCRPLLLPATGLAASCRWLLVFLAIVLGTPLAAQPSVMPKPVAPASPASLEYRDLDGDGVGDVFLETPRFRLHLSGRTGDVSHFYLKGSHFEEVLFPPSGYRFASATLQPFRIGIGGPADASGSIAFSEYVFQTEENGPDQIIVTAAANAVSQPFSVIKRYRFQPKSYAFSCEVAITSLAGEEKLIGNEQSGGVTCRFGPGIFLDKHSQIPNSLLALKPESHLVFDKAESLLKGITGGGFTGVGMKTNYFCMLLEAGVTVTPTAETHEIEATDQFKHKTMSHVAGVALPLFTLKPRESRSFSLKFYFGPKMLDELAAIKREAVTDYGFLSTILLRVLQFFYAIYPNWGLAIILLTVFVRIVLYPLTLKSTKSMAKVQALQPMIQDLKDRFRDDPQKFQEETLKLYQKHQVNPLGGCLPMLLQLPVFIALYNTISIAVELRKTPFLWVADLSQSDPYGLFPVSIALLMYYQQGKMNDPQQQQMLAFMPLFMCFICWSLPAGLLVYWFASSVLGILQQIQANHFVAALKEEKPHHETHR